jgi:hypothetical protein
MIKEVQNGWWTMTPFLRLSLAACLAAAGACGGAHAETTYETAPTRKARDILPDYMIHSDHFTVREDVGWFSGLHEFTVDTEYGSFEIWGEPMLHVRLQEFIAWTALKQVSTTEASVGAVGRQAVSSVTSLLNAFAHPVTTVKGVPKGLERMFRSVERAAGDVGDAADPDKTEDQDGKADSTSGKLTRRLMGIDRAYKRWAEQVQVNPYTTNEAVREELMRLARAEGAVRTGTKILMPGLGFTVSAVARVTRSIYRKPSWEIVEDNVEALQSMGADDVTIDAILGNDNINLSLLTLMVEMLKELDGVDGRTHIIDDIAQMQTDAEAVLFAESLLMADWFNENDTPLVEILPGPLIPVGKAEDGRVIVFTAIDYAYWTEQTAAIVERMTELYRPQARSLEVWIADYVSERFVEETGKRGWTVRSGIRSTVLPEIQWGLQDEEA